MVGCNQPKPIEGLREISFASRITRSIIEDAADLQEEDICLYGAYSLDGRMARVFDAERLYYNNELPGWDYATPQYWINGSVYHFCAVCPYVVPCSFSNEGRVVISDYVGFTDGPDLLYAMAVRDNSVKEDYSAVPLTFDHACAALEFNLINASNQVLKDVRNVRLVGLQNKGNFVFDTSGLASWLLDGTTVSPTAVDQPFGGTCKLPDGGLPVNLGVKYPLYDNVTIMVLPQVVYKTNVTLHLEYIKEGDAEYAIRDIKLGQLGDAATAEWKSGEKYEYNLTITENTITTEVRVVDWIDHFVDL